MMQTNSKHRHLDLIASLNIAQKQHETMLVPLDNLCHSKDMPHVNSH